MGIGSIGSVSFYQQDQNYWQQAQAQSSAQSADASLINVMGQAEVNQAKGLASIANDTALKRVDSQITALVQSALGDSSTSSSSSGSTGSSTSAATSSASSTSPTPATGTGTVPLTASTSLSSLGILSGGTFSVDDGTNTTQYTSTGTDTVADLINAINTGSAFVTASINASGRLIITGRNDTEVVTVSGSGNDAAYLGFGTGNVSFIPKAPSSTAANSSSASTSSTNAASTSGKSTSSTTKSSASSSTAVTSLAQEISSSAASILSADGVSGSLVDMLA